MTTNKNKKWLVRYQAYLSNIPIIKTFFIILLRSSNVLWQTLFHKLNLYTLTSVIAYSLTGLQNKAILLALISQEASEKDKLNNLPWMRCIVLSMSPLPFLPIEPKYFSLTVLEHLLKLLDEERHSDSNFIVSISCWRANHSFKNLNLPFSSSGH